MVSSRYHSTTLLFDLTFAATNSRLHRSTVVIQLAQWRKWHNRKWHYWLATVLIAELLGLAELLFLITSTPPIIATMINPITTYSNTLVSSDLLAVFSLFCCCSALFCWSSSVFCVDYSTTKFVNRVARFCIRTVIY